MITPSFSLTATERVLPRLALDFTTASLDSRITFTRSGNTATVTNSNGYVVPINADLPRFDYDPIALICKGLLIEESRTNLSLYSEDFRNTADAGSVRPWAYTNLSLTADAITAPSNSLTADKLVEGAVNNYHFIQQTIVVATATAHTVTIYAKAAERNFINVQLGGTAYSNQGVSVNLTTGDKLEYNAPTSTSVTNAGNGWWRISITATSANIAATVLIFTNFSLNGNATYAGDGTSGLYVWGFQLEAGAFPTSYIPTVASQVTRNADVATMTGTNFSDWYNASEGAYVWQGIVNPLTDTGQSFFLFSANDGTTGNQIRAARRDTTGSDRVVRAQIDVGGVQAEGLIASGNGVFTGGVTHNLALAYKLNSMGMAFDGALIGTDTSVTIPTVNKLNIGTDHSAVGLTFLNGYIQKLAYYPQRLTNAELTAFSK